MQPEPELGVHGRPRVVVSAITSADGRLTLRRDCLLLDEDTARVWRSLQPASAESLVKTRWSQLDRLYHPEAIMEGSGTFVTDDAGPLELPAARRPADVLYADHVPEGTADRPDHNRWFTVVDSRGRVRWQLKRDGGADLLVLVARSTPAEYLAYLRREQVAYLVVGQDRVDLGLALRRMQDGLGVTCVVSEAGGALNAALLRAGLVDEIQLLVLPAVVGGRDTPAVFDGPQLTDEESPTRLRLLSSHAETDGMLWLRYEVLRSGQ